MVFDVQLPHKAKVVTATARPLRRPPAFVAERATAPRHLIFGPSISVDTPEVNDTLTHTPRQAPSSVLLRRDGPGTRRTRATSQDVSFGEHPDEPPTRATSQDVSFGEHPDEPPTRATR